MAAKGPKDETRGGRGEGEREETDGGTDCVYARVYLPVCVRGREVACPSVKPRSRSVLLAGTRRPWTAARGIGTLLGGARK